MPATFDARLTETRAGGDIQSFPIQIAPGRIRGLLRRDDPPQEMSVLGKYQNTPQTDTIDVSVGINLHAISPALIHRGQLSKDLSCAERAVWPHLEYADMVSSGVVVRQIKKKTAAS
ncbi:MAG TPA: hypothetical protein QGI62_09040 [Anaerolineales bacterium]|jgi:hypothetical protein|nr:hypothetical protein [Anaerolineales bacterium]|tara:strand:+ start:817 stop:1167 length:351 start_codon:yes stop_codon:yes gene_type:complete